MVTEMLMNYYTGYKPMYLKIAMLWLQTSFLN